MKVSEQIKLAGIKNLASFSDMVGVSVTTLRDWSRTRPKMFSYLLKGVMCEKLHNKG